MHVTTSHRTAPKRLAQNTATMADDAKWEALMRKAAGADDYQRAVSPPPPNKKAAKAHKRALKAWLAAPAACDGAAEQLACLFEPSACSRPGKPGPLVVIHDFLPTDAAQGALAAFRAAPRATWTSAQTKTDRGRKSDGAGSTLHKYSVGDGTVVRRKKGHGEQTGAKPAGKREQAARDSIAAIIAAMRGLAPARTGIFQAGRYTRGNFIEPHDDVAYRDIAVSAGAGGRTVRHERQVAMIYYLTQDWEESMGGAFVDLETGVAHVPRFNTLVAFAVPRLHEVSRVTTDRRRFSVFGWFYRPCGTGTDAVGAGGGAGASSSGGRSEHVRKGTPTGKRSRPDEAGQRRGKKARRRNRGGGHAR